MIRRSKTPCLALLLGKRSGDSVHFNLMELNRVKVGILQRKAQPNRPARPLADVEALIPDCDADPDRDGGGDIHPPFRTVKANRFGHEFTTSGRRAD